LRTSEQFVNVNNDESSGRHKEEEEEATNKQCDDCWATDKETAQDVLYSVFGKKRKVKSVRSRQLK